jgi:hypothetical protein
MKITTLKMFIRDYYYDRTDFILKNKQCITRATVSRWIRDNYRVIIYKERFEILKPERKMMLPKKKVSLYHDVEPDVPLLQDWMDY